MYRSRSRYFTYILQRLPLAHLVELNKYLFNERIEREGLEHKCVSSGGHTRALLPADRIAWSTHQPRLLPQWTLQGSEIYIRGQGGVLNPPTFPVLAQRDGMWGELNKDGEKGLIVLF